MPRLVRTLLFLAGIAGLVTTFSVTTKIDTIREEGHGVVDADGKVRWYAKHSVYRIGLACSPWFEYRLDESSICGTERYQVKPISWSSAIFCASVLCLGFARRIRCVPSTRPETLDGEGVTL